MSCVIVSRGIDTWILIIPRGMSLTEELYFVSKVKARKNKEETVDGIVINCNRGHSNYLSLLCLVIPYAKVSF